MRRFVLATICLSLLMLHTHSELQSAEPSSSAGILSTTWKFHPGDDSQWSDRQWDDSQWESISVGEAWESQGHADLDGFAWYRLRVQVPESFRKDSQLDTYGGLRLLLGKIDDVDQTWWNGKLIGETGQMPRSYSTRWSNQRTYHIPVQDIRWDEHNVIAVRVFDGGSEGGMYEGPYELKIASWQDLPFLA
jgi:hypothetical protein